MTDKTNNKMTDDEHFLASLRWERGWRESLPRINEREWLQEFPEMRPRIRSLIAKYEGVKEKNLSVMREMTNKIKTKSKPENKWFWEEAMKYLCPAVSEVAAANRHIKRLRYLIEIPNKYQRSWEKKIEIAKTKSILEVAEASGLKLKRSGTTYVALCPFHRERTASCTFYPRDNRFYCYGCQARGDIINFIRLLEPHASFKEVVDKLQ